MIWKKSLNHRLINRKKQLDTTQAITKRNENLGDAILKRIDECDRITQRSNKSLADIIE